MVITCFTCKSFCTCFFSKCSVEICIRVLRNVICSFYNLYHRCNLLRNTTEITTVLFYLRCARSGHVSQGILWFVFLNLQIEIESDVDISPITRWLHPYLTLISCNRATVTYYFSAQYNHASKTT